MSDFHHYFRKQLDLESEVSLLIRFILKDHDPTSFSTGEKILITSSHDIPPVIQNGPMCGIVCLTMAALLLERIKTPPETLCAKDKLHPKSILEYAITNTLSRQGEMFSADAMKSVIKDHLLYQAKIANIESSNSLQEMLSGIISGQNAILVPYDKDKNHSPCLAGGHRAHWCLLVGLCLVLESTSDSIPLKSDLLKCCHLPSDNSNYYVVSQDSLEHFMAIFETLDHCTMKDKNQLYVFARHGRSSHLGLWGLRELLESNRNLLEVNPQRSNTLEYVFPEGELKEGLKDKAIIISK